MSNDKKQNSRNVIFEDRNDMFHMNFGFIVEFWRLNPHRFAKEFLGISVHDFQKYLLYELNKQDLTYAILFASRGLGKSWLCCLYACMRCILYPGTTVVVAAPIVAQAIKFLEKVDELVRKSPNLKASIKSTSKDKNGAKVEFWNTSRIFTCPANQNARGIRCNILILDEFIKMDKVIVDEVLVPFLTSKRDLPYLSLPKYKNVKNNEHNVNINLSSVAGVTDWGYKEFQKNSERETLQNDTGYFNIALPYQFGVESGIIDDKVIERQLKSGGSIDTFKQEMECIPFGENENALFSYRQIAESRNLEKPLIPINDDEFVQCNGDITRFKYYEPRPKVNGYIRILSMDIAVSARKDADNSVIIVMDAIPTRNDEYKIEIRYIEIPECSDIDPQALRLKQLYYDLSCDYVVIDANGALGLNMYSILGNVTSDSVRGIVYPAWRKCDMSPEVSENPDDMNAEPVIYGIKVSGLGASELIYQMNLKAKIYFERRRISLLYDDTGILDKLDKRYNYSLLKSSNSAEDKELASRIISPFLNTTLLQEEAVQTKMIRLPSGRFTIVEGKARKDRVITLMYGIYFINKLEEDLKYNSKKFDYSDIVKARAELVITKSPDRPVITAKPVSPFGGKNIFSRRTAVGFGNRRR